MNDRMVWIDCEMTGLSLSDDALIEVAALVTDSELNVLGDGVDIVIRPPESALETMPEVVRQMHTASGLLDELAGGTTLADAEQQVLAYVREHVKEPGKAANTGHAIVALSVEAFAPPKAFKRQVDDAIRAMRGAERLPGTERIWLPGEQSHRKRLDRMKNGVPMPKSLRESLDATARDLGIPPLTADAK